jgi:hypothetical protein
MKKLIIITFIILIILNNQIIAQKSIKSIKPLSFNYQSLLKPLTKDENIETIIMSQVSKDSLIKVDEEKYKTEPGSGFTFGYVLEKKVNITNSDNWDYLEDGGRLKRIKIICPGAFSVNLAYDQFELPEGAYLFLYNDKKNYVLGAFSKKNNKPSKKFMTDLVPGDFCWLEYKGVYRTIINNKL